MTAHVSAAARTSLRTVATTRSATGSTRRSISPASMRKSGRMRRQHTWSISRCSATATTRTPPASAISTAVRLIELAVLPRSQGRRVQDIDFRALRLGMFFGQLAPFSSTLHCSPSRRDAQPGYIVHASLTIPSPWARGLSRSLRGPRFLYPRVRRRRVAPSRPNVWRRVSRRALRCGRPACAGR